MTRQLYMSAQDVEAIQESESRAHLFMGTKTVFFTLKSIASSAVSSEIDWNKGQKQKITLTNDPTLTFIKPTGSCNLVLVLAQDGLGTRVVTWPANVKWPDGTAPTLTFPGLTTDIVSFFYDATADVYYGQASLNFS